jgi:hypothetical protein
MPWLVKQSTNRVITDPEHAKRTKFQADLAPADDRATRILKEELQVPSNLDLLADALALFRTPRRRMLVSIFSDKRAERETREWAGTALLSIDPAGDETQAALKEALTDPLSSIQALAAGGLKKNP